MYLLSTYSTVQGPPVDWTYGVFFFFFFLLYLLFFKEKKMVIMVFCSLLSFSDLFICDMMRCDANDDQVATYITH